MNVCAILIYIYILLNEISIEEYTGWVFYFTVVYNIIYTHTDNICIHNKNSIGIVALCNSGNWLHSVARMDIIHRCVYYYRCIIHSHKRCRPPNTHIHARRSHINALSPFGSLCKMRE